MAWLRRRLREISDGWGTCTLAVIDGAVAGISIETPKAEGKVKLSTLFVNERYRRRGVGTALVARCTQAWAQQSIPSAYVTVATAVEPRLGPILTSFGFLRSAIVKNRYGRDRHEAIYDWEPRMKAALFSMHPTYAAAAFDGTKCFEYRRCRVHVQTGDLIVVYETAPASCVTGSFRVGRVVHGDDSLAQLERSSRLRKEIRNYLRGVRSATAIEICNASRLTSPHALTELEGVERPPQSYCFLLRSPQWVSLR